MGCGARKATLANNVYEILRKHILKGALVPEQRLIERSLSVMLGVSRTPLRQALHRLEAELFLERIPKGGGYLVRKLKRDDIMALFRVRLELEDLAIRWAMPNVTPVVLSELERLNARMMEFWGKGDVERVTNADSGFHRVICRMSGNRILVELLDSLKNRIHRIIAKGWDAEGSFDVAIREHAAILEAVRKGRSAHAGRVLREHLARSMGTALTQV